MMTRIREWIQLRWKSKWVVVGRDYLRRYGVITGIGIVAAYLLGRWLDAQAWTGFHGRKYGDAKTLWDWLDLLIVPTVLAIGAYIFNRRAAIRDKEREEAAKEREIQREAVAKQREKEWEEATRYEEILQEYLDDMSQLLMKEGLKAALRKRNKKAKSKQEDENEADGEPEEETETETDEELPVVDVARARTVSTLRRLKDPQRRRELLDFLLDAGLYSGETALLRNAKMDGIDLEKTDLRKIDLRGASVRSANLKGANLAEANLVGAHMYWADLEGANLLEANLKGTKLGIANLELANLVGADLSGARLGAAKLVWADLAWVNLEKADLVGANLEHSYLVGATGIETARFDERTKLPDGTKWREGVDWTQWTEPKKDAGEEKKE